MSSVSCNIPMHVHTCSPLLFLSPGSLFHLNSILVLKCLLVSVRFHRWEDPTGDWRCVDSAVGVFAKLCPSLSGHHGLAASLDWIILLLSWFQYCFFFFFPLSFRFSAVNSSWKLPMNAFPCLLTTLNKKKPMIQVEMFQNLYHVEWVSVINRHKFSVYAY